MALVSLRQLLDHAAENGYGLPAFNVNNLEQIQAIMQAADECNSPVIMQGSAGARKYAGEAFLRHLIEAAVEAYPHIPIVMHQDHGASPSVCVNAIRSGFSSVMMDGSLQADAKTPSTNESVVIFDRIRENFRKHRRASITQVIDNAITQTMSRTIITHGSTQMVVIAMLLFGGEVLYYFSLALTIGILFGIYSSIMVGSSIIMLLGVKREDLVKLEKKPLENDGAVV